MSERVAVVTGAARGIGAACAKRLAADGYAVALWDLRAEDCEKATTAIRAEGGVAIAVPVDVTQPDAVSAARDATHEALGPISVVVNNAGVTRDDLLFRMSLDNWEQVMAVHLRGAFLVTQAAQKDMVDAGWGRIISLSSTSALGNRGQANYAAAKAGIQGFTRTLAIELGRYGITANAVAPGFIDTEMTRATAERVGQTFEEFSRLRVENIPVGRPGQPEDVASLVSYFASEGSGFVSGQTVYVAGGPRG